ncbi:uncharacterized protein F5Z01DRAFT_251305 [Emericellopsis atlantica]|uniref:Modin n=1 Tax=Emericellopsis atlantica TaxID=2614577 RepID=A0A9P7ZIK8_9HYPO|nr:uncharacterized protein F5Z01DRAFT_251305 [Emericellopsis atlantica]KAG9252138.1 hypothetical protein F5Z01DRAFT_251305 [Emericellopsis atlantica]
MGWDPATIAGVAALVVAIVAMIIAVAQATQQYFITGQQIRLCDSVVYGPMPGQGRRVWEMSQFRFRVLYSMPQISLEPRHWGSGGGAIRRSCAIAEHPLPCLRAWDALTEVNSGQTVNEMSSPGQQALRRRRPAPEAGEVERHAGKETRKSTVPPGEASWVSFCRAVERSCGDSIRVDYVECDVDRCPSDLVSVPMPTSMRDIVIMGLTAGMVVTRASFEEKSVSMQGPAGSLTSASHPVLGPILHFTPTTLCPPVPQAFGVSRTSPRGTVDDPWLGRILDVPSVANQYYHWVKRRTARRLDERWIKDHQGLTGYEIHVASVTKTKASAKGTNLEQKTSPSDGERRGLARTDPYQLVEHKPADGAWVMIIYLPPPCPYGKRRGPQRRAGSGGIPEPDGEANQKHSAKGHARSGNVHASSYRRPKVEDADDEGESVQPVAEKTTSSPPADPRKDSESPVPPLPPGFNEPPSLMLDDEDEGGHERDNTTDPLAERKRIAKERQAARAVKMDAIQKDMSLVQQSVEQGAMTSPYEEAAAERRGDQIPKLLTYHSLHSSADAAEKEPPPVTDEAYEARDREKEREEAKLARGEARHKRNLARTQVMRMTRVDVFWLSQVDITGGQWVTPWHDAECLPLSAAAAGGITVILEALLGFLDEKSLLYTGSSMETYRSFQETAYWMLEGRTTSFPAYALNARGGVVAQGTYIGVNIPVLEGVVPALQLLHSYEWQVSTTRNNEDNVEESNVELMRIDAWLSYVGRTDQIANGPRRLLKQTPALIALLVEEHELDFQNMDLSAEEGGWQDIADAAADLMDTLVEEELNEAEQLYVLVALLRTLKVVQSVWAGSDSHDLRTILERDVQVHLV